MVEKVWGSPEIFCVQVQLPQNPLRNLNSYVIRTPERTLVIDTGFCRPECRAALWAGLEELGIEPSRTALFLTHLHSDHTGLVWDFVEKGIPVYMGAAEREYYAAYSAAGSIRSLFSTFQAEGFPQEQLDLQSSNNQALLYAPRPGYPAIPLEDGQTLSLGGVQIRAVHTPGHTPGHTALYLPEKQLLFSGDHILFDITPNISIWPGVPHSLTDYMESMRKIRRLPIQKTFPAHRASGADVYGRIDQILHHHEQRLEEIFRAVAEDPGCTAYETAGRIRWSARGLPWTEFPPHQRWFAMGETVAHLYYLVQSGRLTRTERDGSVHYYPADAEHV